MRPFRYARADDVPGAVALLAQAPNGAYLGGGGNLVDLMKLNVATPDLLVDVRRLTSDRVEELPGGGISIGAATSNSDLAADPLVRYGYPVLSQALLSGASGQLRNLNDGRRKPAATDPLPVLSRTSPPRATSGSPAPDARRSRGTIAISPCWAPRRSASRPTRRTSPWR